MKFGMLINDSNCVLNHSQQELLLLHMKAKMQFKYVSIREPRHLTQDVILWEDTYFMLWVGFVYDMTMKYATKRNLL
jgi:hypothetical protein